MEIHVGKNKLIKSSRIFRGKQNTAMPRSCTKKAQRAQSEYIILIAKRIFRGSKKKFNDNDIAKRS